MVDTTDVEEKEEILYLSLSNIDLQLNLKVVEDFYVDYMFQIVSSNFKKVEAKVEIQAFFSIVVLQSKQKIVLVS